jgi:hypothetical protein
MTSTPKKKLCWNCEGRVSLAEENCPYCAVYLGPAPNEKGEAKDILAPPYRLVEAEEETVPPSPYAFQNSEQKPTPEDSEISVATSDLKQVVLPLGLLSGGSLCFVFGLILFAFSENGVFTLSWNGDSWYFYLLFAAPMLFIGWWTLMRFEDDKEDEPLEQKTIPK